VPTPEEPYGAAFSEDSKTWSIKRDLFLVTAQGTIQLWVSAFHRAGDVLESAVQYVDRGLDDRPGE
jgi:hypothetical protein